MSNVVTINIGKEFSRYPVGRYLADGDSNGERFRSNFVVPSLQKGCDVRIELDDALGYGSSFLEEAFGGLVRIGYPADELLKRLSFVTNDDSLVEEIRSYILDATHG